MVVDYDDCIGTCQNGATCVDAINDYTCHCTSGYIGRRCEASKSTKMTGRQVSAFAAISIPHKKDFIHLTAGETNSVDGHWR